MAPSETASEGTAPLGPVLLAYDGSELAAFAIEQAGRQLAPSSEALVICVWQPSDVGFLPTGGRSFHATAANEVHEAAQETAAHGASLAERAGFRPRSMAVEAAPSWKGLVDTAEEHGVDLIVLGSHRRSGLAGHLLGSVAAATVSHFAGSVLVVHRRD